jgi:hypothetical protein
MVTVTVLGVSSDCTFWDSGAVAAELIVFSFDNGEDENWDSDEERVVLGLPEAVSESAADETCAEAEDCILLSDLDDATLENVLVSAEQAASKTNAAAKRNGKIVFFINFFLWIADLKKY